MNELSIQVVNTSAQLRRFINFPNRLHRNAPTYIPPLFGDEKNLLTPKNPSLKHCDLKLFLAFRGKKIVGRVAAIINRSVNERWNKKAVRFGWFDFVDDKEVSAALLAAVEDFGREHGLDEIEGPFGFTDMDKEGWAIDNFDARQNLSTLYNPEYYIRHIHDFGYKEKCYWQQNHMPASQPLPEKVERVNALIQEKYKLRHLKFNRRKELYPYARKFFHTLNDAFSELYDFVPLTDEEIEVYIKEYFPFANLDFISFVVDEKDDLVAFGISIPDLNKAYQKANGHLLPFGWFHLLRALHHFDTIDLLLNGVHPDWQRRGVHSIYYAEMNRQAIRHHVKDAYSNPQIIGNEAVKIWGNQYQSTPHMTRAVFAKPIADKEK